VLVGAREPPPFLREVGPRGEPQDLGTNWGLHVGGGIGAEIYLRAGRKMFSELVAENRSAATSQDRDYPIAIRAPGQGRFYIDYLQLGHGKTIAGAVSRCGPLGRLRRFFVADEVERS